MPVNLDPLPLPTTRSLFDWATKVTNYLRVLEREILQPTPRTIQLEHRKDTAKATRDGLVMWCPVTGAPIVSKGGQWYPILLGEALPIVGMQANE